MSTVRIGTALYSLWVSASKSKGRAYERFEFLDPTTSRRVKRASREAAIAELKKRVALGGAGGVELNGSDAQGFKQLLVDLCPTGLTVPEAGALVRELYGLAVANGVPFQRVPEVLRQGTRAVCATFNGCRKSIQEVVAELLAVREADGVGAAHLHDLRLRLGRFGQEVKCALGELTAAIMDEWLRGLVTSRRTRVNYRAALSNLITFAKSRRYLPASFEELAAVTAPACVQPDVAVFTAEEMRWLLAGASESVLPLLLLGGFAGLRQSEVLALKWSNINWEENHILIPAQTKTGRRLAPLLPNLRAWLEPLRAEGRIVTMSAHGVSKAFVRTVDKANRLLEAEKSSMRVAWVRNGPRHSYVSCRCALTQDLARVAEECGHSVGMLMKHYRKVVTPSNAKAWFEIWPDSQPGVRQLSLFRGGKGGFPDTPTYPQPHRRRQIAP